MADNFDPDRPGRLLAKVLTDLEDCFFERAGYSGYRSYHQIRQDLGTGWDAFWETKEAFQHHVGPEGFAVAEAAYDVARTAFTPLAQRAYSFGQPDGSFDAARTQISGAIVTLNDLAKPRTAAVPAPPPTIWYHGGNAFSIDGMNQVSVTEEESNVLLAFLNLQRSMETQDLQVESSVTNVARVYGGLIRKYDGRFAPALNRPGRKGQGGYFARVRTVG